jgi:hypothetical protein
MQALGAQASFAAYQANAKALAPEKRASAEAGALSIWDC